MDDSSLTIESYENNIDRYIQNTPSTIDGAMKKWLDDFTFFLPENAQIFEIGSGTGRDAEFLNSEGYKVFCTDATEGFVSLLQDKGFLAFHFNALTDEIVGNDWDGVLANAVLLHFTVEDAKKVMGKVLRALKPGGVFAFSLKAGNGAIWSGEKLGDPRFFQFWDPADVVYATLDVGFNDVSVMVSPGWIHVIALS